MFNQLMPVSTFTFYLTLSSRSFSILRGGVGLVYFIFFVSFTEILIFNANSINPDHVPRSVASDFDFSLFAYVPLFRTTLDWVSSCKKGEVGGFKHNT